MRGRGNDEVCGGNGGLETSENQQLTDLKAATDGLIDDIFDTDTMPVDIE